MFANVGLKFSLICKADVETERQGEIEVQVDGKVSGFVDRLSNLYFVICDHHTYSLLCSGNVMSYEPNLELEWPFHVFPEYF